MPTLNSVPVIDGATHRLIQISVKKSGLEAVVSATSSALKRFPKNSMGITPDDVRITQDYRLAKAAYDTAFTALRRFNGSLSSKDLQSLAQLRRESRFSMRKES